MIDKSEKSAPINVSAAEIARFDALAESWWDPEGKYKTALDFNRARLEVIQQQIRHHFNRHQVDAPFASLSMVDIGCGGGLISEPLAKKGALVTGIDASATSIEVAKRHAQSNQIRVNYRHQMASELVEDGAQFDVVINAEVVEHVPDQQQLIKECAQLVKPGGLLILATLNRTVKSFVVAIVGAEYVMRYLPVGTHDWRKFVKPRELDMWSGEHLSLKYQTGMALNPFTGKWKLSASMAVNYLLCFEHTLA